MYDGLRTTDAQHAMTQSEVVKNNPQWLEPPRLLSPPGAGAHPRGMAIDIGLRDAGGALVDMGTDFDFLAQNSAAEFNPAHRAYPHLKLQHRKNRAVLDNAMLRAAECLHLPLFLLPQEWWDFRMPEEIFNSYAPLSDADLPPAMRMVHKVEPFDNPEYYRSIFEKEYERLSAFI